MYIKLFEAFISTENLDIITNPTDDDFNDAVNFAADVLYKEGQPRGLQNYLQYNCKKELSIIIKNKSTNKIIGVLLCKEETLTNIIEQFNIPEEDILIDIDEIKDKLCIEGFVLAVDKEYRFSKIVYTLYQNINKNYYGLIIKQDERLQKNINYLRKGAQLVIKSNIHGSILNLYFGKFE